MGLYYSDCPSVRTKSCPLYKTTIHFSDKTCHGYFKLFTERHGPLKTK